MTEAEGNRGTRDWVEGPRMLSTHDGRVAMGAGPEVRSPADKGGFWGCPRDRGAPSDGDLVIGSPCVPRESLGDS
jgi:hypothetical protein